MIWESLFYSCIQWWRIDKEHELRYVYVSKQVSWMTGITYDHIFIIPITKFYVLRLRARIGYLGTFIAKWLKQKLDLGNRDWFTIAIHDTRSRPKSVGTLKKGCEVSGFGRGQRALTIWVNHIVRDFLFGFSDSLAWYSEFQNIPKYSK